LRSESFYILNYLLESGRLTRDEWDSLKFELDQQIYSYGQQFKVPIESSRWTSSDRLKAKIKRLIVYTRSLRGAPTLKGCKRIVSNALFDLNRQLRTANLDIRTPPWSPYKDPERLNEFKAWDACDQIARCFAQCDFRTLLAQAFRDELDLLMRTLKEYFIRHNVSALIVPNDLSYFENSSIRIFKELSRPSFVFLHGLPSRYNNIDDNRAKYLLVWGEQIKQHYVKAGVDPGKIFVTGHPRYREKGQIGDLRFCLDDVLLITKSMPWAHMVNSQPIISDRGNIILYLWYIEDVLRSLGVRSVRFRPHPSENQKWYLRFLNPDFFKLDPYYFAESIRRATLVIGPTSTVFLEALWSGVNYLVFEPSVQNVDVINYELVPPFDGSDPKVPVARTLEELRFILTGRIMTDPAVLDAYIQTPFDVSEISRHV
jgi:hypothetical protein